MGHISDSRYNARLDAVERIVDHKFADRELLLLALTHPSFSEEAHSEHDYERLEFLGDAVLGMIVVEEIYRRFPNMPEGQLTKLKIGVVSGTTLSHVARSLGMGDLMLLGRSEQGTNGRGLESALENVFEAIVGALYLDAGIDAAREYVLRVLGKWIDPDVAAVPEHPKSLLQEKLQAKGLSPEYETVATSGPPHDRSFRVTVSVNGMVVGTGEGASKKEAEMNAACEALDDL